MGPRQPSVASRGTPGLDGCCAGPECTCCCHPNKALGLERRCSWLFSGQDGPDLRGVCAWMSWEDLGEVRCQVRGLFRTGFGALCWEKGLPPPLCPLGIYWSGAWLFDGHEGRVLSPCICRLGSAWTGRRCWQRWAARLAGRGPPGRAASRPPHRTVSTQVSFSRLLRARALHVAAPGAVPAPASCHFCTFSLGVTIRQLPPGSSRKTPTLLCREMSVWLLGTQEYLQWGPGSQQLPRARAEGGKLGGEAGTAPSLLVCLGDPP